jgi:hypothetical protein
MNSECIDISFSTWSSSLRWISIFTLYVLCIMFVALLRAGWSGVQVPTGARNFSPHHRVQTGSGAHLASCTRGPFPGDEADHSPPSSAEIKNAWSYTSTPNTTGTTLSLPSRRSTWKGNILRCHYQQPNVRQISDHMGTGALWNAVPCLHVTSALRRQW